MTTVQRLREIKRLADDETTPTHELVEKIGLVALLALREIEANPASVEALQARIKELEDEVYSRPRPTTFADWGEV